MPKQPTWTTTLALATVSFSAVLGLGYIFLWAVS